jgi:3-methyladenine DNA glycosylase AlkD
VVRSIAKHGEKQASAVAESGLIPMLVQTMNVYDPSVKEAACWALGFIGRHSAELSEAVAAAGAIPLLAMCYKEPEMTLRRIAVSTLSDLAKHAESVAAQVVSTGIVPQLVADIESHDAGLKRQVTSCLGQIAKHSMEFADILAKQDTITKSVSALKDTGEWVRKNACALLREISKHSESLATQLVMSGGIAGLTEYLIDSDTHPGSRLPAVMTLGYICSVSETLAMAVIGGDAIPLVDKALIEDPEETVKSACVWTLSQIGKHSPEHAKAVIHSLPKILAAAMHAESSDDFKEKAKEAFKAIVSNITDTIRLEPLLDESPKRFLKYIVRQFAKVLPNDMEGRKHFVTSGCLQRVLQVTKGEEDEKLVHAVQDLKAQFPPDIVSYFSPDYSIELIKKLDDFIPPKLSM